VRVCACVSPLTRLGGSTDFGDSKIVLDPRRSPVLGTRSSEPMHTIRANLYWEFQFVLGYIAVPRSRIRPGNPLRVGRGPRTFRFLGPYTQSRGASHNFCDPPYSRHLAAKYTITTHVLCPVTFTRLNTTHVLWSTLHTCSGARLPVHKTTLPSVANTFVNTHSTQTVFENCATNT
jgi:hypothetical protein